MRPPHPSLLLLAIICLLLATGCGGRGIPTTTVPGGGATRVAFAELGGGYGIWVAARSASEQASSEEDAARFAEFLARHGVRLVLLECRTLGDEVIFPSYTHKVLEEDGGLLQRVIAANSAHGIETVAVLPLFLGEPEEGQAPMEARLDSEGEAVRLTPRRVDPLGAELPYRSLFSDVVRHRTELVLRELAQVEGLSSVAISHVGFPSHTTDFKGEARISFEHFLGQAVEPWPDAILTTEGSGPETRTTAGPLWADWAQWRTGVVTTLMFQVTALLRTESEIEQGQPVDVALMAGGYLDQLVRTGVSWTSFDDPQESGMAELFDRLYLEFYVPVVTREEARARGLRESASLEDAVETSRRRVPETVERWAVISLVPYLDERGRLTTDGRRQLRAALRMTRAERVPVVLMDYELMKRNVAWDDVRNALATP